ncbi:MAG: hypothetical protein WBC22_10900 [Sedimentisphaerales bacterium]
MLMIRIIQIAVLGSLALWPAGCNSIGEEPIWEHVKITDLAPSDNNKQPDTQLLKTINFNLYIFEIPAEDIGTLDDVWPMVYDQPLRFNSFEAFGANLFLAGFGQIPMWGRIADLLRSADGIQAGTVSLLLPDGQSNDVAVAVLGQEQTVFYISNKGLTKRVKLGPGQLGLRIQAEKIPDSRGICKVSVLPVFSPLKRSSIRPLPGREKSGEFLFTSAGFILKMSPGDFVLVGPDEYDRGQTTLGSLFFSKPEGSLFFNELERKAPKLKPSVRLFLVVCTSINF